MDLKTKLKFAFYFSCFATLFAVMLNYVALRYGYWNFMVGQSLIVCPIIAIVTYMAGKNNER